MTRVRVTRVGIPLHSHTIKMSADPRGIHRGLCKKCDCTGYSVIGAGSLKCKCGHAPGVHENLTNLSSVAPTGVQYGTQPSAATSTYAGVVTGASAAGGYQHSSHYSTPYSHQSSTGGYYQPTRLPECKADGCSNQVFYDPEVGVFEYCSPDCRDAYLLPKENEKLKSDLKELLEQLHAVRVAEGGSSGSGHVMSDVDPPTKSPPGGKPKTAFKHLKLVTVSKRRNDDLGLIVNQKEYKLGKNQGLLVTGVVLSGGAVHLLKSGDIKFFDVIERVNGQHYSQFIGCFEQETKKLGDVTLGINHSVSLTCPKRIISEADRIRTATHIFVLQAPHTASHGDGNPFGVTCRYGSGNITAMYGLHVQTCTKYNVANDSGLEFGDVILLYTNTGKGSEIVVPKEENSNSNAFNDYLCKAAQDSKKIVLLVSRARSRHTAV